MENTSLYLWAQFLPSALFCLVVVRAGWRLFGRAPGWPQRTLALGVCLALVWGVAPLASALAVWLLKQLPFVVFGLVALGFLLRPRRRF
ncbi:MAG: hypothetical protein IIV90_07505 [Oscillospiraceae bacterium]|nr:hypothetical protein [Oscillospiraceae bacterium]